jgi:hypothetical protein
MYLVQEGRGVQGHRDRTKKSDIEGGKRQGAGGRKVQTLHGTYSWGDPLALASPFGLRYTHKSFNIIRKLLIPPTPLQKTTVSCTHKSFKVAV